jgi:hypothetical protein
MTNISWIATKDQAWIAQWDSIQLNSPKGMFTQCSSWLQSYQPYGFDYLLFLGVSGEKIHAGFACIFVRIGSFKLVNCNWGPYLDGEVEAKESIQQLYLWAKSQGAISLQLNVASEEFEVRKMLERGDFSFSKGDQLRKVFSPVNFNWISFPDSSSGDEEQLLLKSFSENARRNIKTALKNGLVVEQVNSPESLRLAYQCFENNAAREGYPIRDWEDLKPSLTNAMLLGQSLFFIVKMDDKILGAIWAAKGGGSYHYIMGGVERTEKDLKIGHLLQWSVMKAGMAAGMDKYNISVGGSEGVVRFKASFNPVESHSEGVFHATLVPWKYRLFKYGYQIAERNKKLASKVLKLLK